MRDLSRQDRRPRNLFKRRFGLHEQIEIERVSLQVSPPTHD